MRGLRRLTALALAGVLGLAAATLAGAAEPAASSGDAALRLARALAGVEAQRGHTSPQLLPILGELAALRLSRGALSEAAELRRRALRIALGRFGPGSATAAEAMLALAAVQLERRRYLDAEPLLLIAETVLSGSRRDDRPALPLILAGRARVALARGDAAEALGFAERAAAMMRRNRWRSSAEPLRVLGAALAAARRFREAEAVLVAAVAQDRRLRGAEHPETARSLAQLAGLYLRQDRAADALPLIEQAAAIDQARLGPTHPLIADDFADLGQVYDRLGRPAAALRAFRAAIAVLERGDGRNTPRVAYAELEISRIERQRDNEADAESAYKDARRILNKAEDEERRRERRA